MNFEKCDCPNCDGCREVRGSVEDVIVEAVNAVEAAELANFEASDPWWEFQGVRLVGTDATFAIPAA